MGQVYGKPAPDAADADADADAFGCFVGSGLWGTALSFCMGIEAIFEMYLCVKGLQEEERVHEKKRKKKGLRDMGRHLRILAMLGGMKMDLRRQGDVHENASLCAGD